MEQDMQNNNHGSNWKNRLDDRSGFGNNDLPDTNMIWDKLYQKLHQPRRKKSIWYWAAAATLFTGIIVAILFLPQQQIKSNYTATVVPQKQTGELHPAVQSNEKPVITIQESGKQTINAEHLANHGLQNSTVIPAKKEQQLTEKNNYTIISAPVALSPVETKLPGDTVSATALLTTQPKAKLKVVHVNELGSTDDKSINRPVVDYSVIQFGVNSQQLNKSSLPSGKIGLNISTNKSSPSN